MMHPTLSLMLSAQDIEHGLKALKQQAEGVAVPLERAKARRQAMRRDLQALKDKLERVIQDRRRTEKDLLELEGKLTAAQSRQSAVRNPKEALALEHQIDTAQAAATAAETAVFDLMEQEENLGKRLETDSARTGRDLEALDTEIKRLNTLLQEKIDLANGLREERIAALNRMDEETRENYEWLVNKYGPGTAVAPVSGAACGGCGSMLLPDQKNKVRDTSALHRCSHCYRFMMQND